MPRRLIPPRGPDRDAALEQYRQRASIYDWELALFEPVRRLAISKLGLHSGDVVLDVGCGTGLSFPMLRKAIGPNGRIVGVEQSPEMVEQARRRIARERCGRVKLISSPVETANIRVEVDAALFHFTHDILRRPEAIANVMRQLKPGARVVASGLKWARPWPVRPVNLLVLSAALRSVTSLDGMDRPWQLLEEQLGPMKVEPLLFGGAFVASGVHRV